MGKISAGFMFVAFLGLLLMGCAAGPRLETTGVDPALTPQAVRAAPAAAQGHTVLWGGEVISVTPMRQATRIELLGFPLDSSQRPDTRSRAQGRFWIIRQGYLEPLDFGSGRLVTVRGQVAGVEQGRVGAATYVYPVVTPTRIYLWPVTDTRPRVHFGIGVMFGN
jgi:outer membrane lipoprotein